MKEHVLDRFIKKKSVVGIIGLGYVGLPLAIRFSNVGFKVLGFDVDGKKIDDITAGRSYIEHILPESIEESRAQGFEASLDFSRTIEADALIICVPTPLNKYREPDLNFITESMDKIAPYLRKGQVVSLESTTYPGTTEEELLTRIESEGFKVGEDIFLVYSPEREDPGNKDFETRTIPKVVGGHTPSCLEVGVALYSQAIDQVVQVSSTKAAEMTKLLENIHRSVNIGLVNEMKIVADQMGIDIHEVIKAASTKPFGFTPYYPGPGLGGHCIPIDPFYLTWKAREFNINTRFIELAGEVNSNMPLWVMNKAIDALNDRSKSVKGATVLFLGVAYKKNVDDMRESPAIKLMGMFEDKGAALAYSDPHIPSFLTSKGNKLESVELTPEALASYDMVILTTNHDKFDYKMIQDHSKVVVDTRGVFKVSGSNIVKA